MRETNIQNEALFAYVTPESFVPKDHPLRAIRSTVKPKTATSEQHDKLKKQPAD
ncbi:hypothetical protein [Trichlorobacter lovleyi]|jgi:transposase, IS4 family|uniref:hypothetical protein n=1 Tax=Trichlorobacter lovleyi TaxID=313985 RepID=UPI0000E957D6|nr:hypothetical protein [Trichlorobacter lovleyi]